MNISLKSKHALVGGSSIIIAKIIVISVYLN